MRSDINTLPPYEPEVWSGEVAERYGILPGEMIRMDLNENPYGASPRALEALHTVNPNSYPDAQSRELRRLLGEHCGVAPECIVTTNGGDEAIDLVFRLYLDPGDEVINCPPTFGEYRIAALRNRGRMVDVQRREDHSIDLAAIERAVTPRTTMIILCNPNNPTGTVTPRDDVIRLLDLGIPLFLDEAYSEFRGWSDVDLMQRYPHLITLRTMSKWAALAGLRVGYAIAAPEVAERMRAIRAVFALNVAGEAAAIASVRDTAYLMANVQRLKDGTAWLREHLSRYPFFEVPPTVTNFNYCKPIGVDPAAIHAELERRGIMVRLYRQPPALRISSGTEEQNYKLVAAMGEIAAVLGVRESA
jgi:histidinol-phosphate aminotransferase